MSLENDDDSLVVEANESEKKPRISYTREFLLTFSELETCKGLPSGFDRSILSGLEDSSVQEWPRPHSGLPLQSFRRNDYSSSPPTRGDSRGYGRWDSRSSGWSDKDGDSQSEADQDSGRRNYGNQPRRPRQNSEHDGLLGSGSFPRPSGFASGTSAPKSQTNEPYHLNRSNEAYQPPRPYKAVPHVRPNTHDSFNDETFGSTESTSQDRAEEERKRRASFELMRKEQQKVLQEKQKSSANKQQSDEFTDMLLEEAKEEGLSEASGELNSAVQAVPKDDFGKSSIMSQSSKPRPLVPPGFKSSILEKSSTSKPISSTDKEDPKPAIEEFHLLAKGNHTQNGTLDNLGMGDPHLLRISGFPEVHEAVDGEVFELMTNKFAGNKVPSNPSQESTASILGKFFGSSPTIKEGGSTGFLEKSKQDDPLSPNNAQSSKFALWFNEDDKKPVDDLSSGRSNDLLSLLGGGGLQPANIVSAEPIAPDIPYKGFGITKPPSDSKQLFNNMRQESTPVAAVLTCEDLEQTILSEYTEKSSTLQPPLPDWNVSGPESVDARAVDNTATNHLLSLLQKGTGPSIDDTSNTSIGLFGDRPTSEKPKDQQASSGQNLSLEALFGSAFMQELQSAQAPVSAQRGSAGSARIDIFEPQNLSVPSVDGIAPNMTNFENNPLSLRQKQPAKSDDPENWLKFDGQRADVDPLEFPRGVPKSGNDIQLPEEESLMIVGDPANTHNPSEAVFNISEKLAALNSGFRGDHFGRGPYDMMEPERQFNNNPQMHGAQMNHNRRPMLYPLDPMNSQMRFQEHLMQRDNAPINQQFPPRPFHHPDARVTGFDVPINVNPQMLPPQLRNFPPPQMLRDHPRPQASSFMPEQGFPFNHQQPNIGGLGMPFPVPNAGSGNQNPEAFQRMMEMELRAQSKHTPHSQGMYELDMGFRYR